jgi:hypothetical protein
MQLRRFQEGHYPKHGPTVLSQNGVISCMLCFSKTNLDGNWWKHVEVKDENASESLQGAKT